MNPRTFENSILLISAATLIIALLVQRGQTTGTGVILAVILLGVGASIRATTTHRQSHASWLSLLLFSSALTILLTQLALG